MKTNLSSFLYICQLSQFKSVSSISMKNYWSILLSIFILIISGQLSIDLPEQFSTVPITAQTLAVLTIAYLFPSYKGCLAIFIYVLLGALGAPVFSGWTGGLDSVTGKSGGFIIGFLVAAVSIYFLRKPTEDALLRIGTLHLTGTVIILFCGFSWLIPFIGVEYSFTKGVVPYLPGAVIKIIVGSLLCFYFKYRV